MRALWSDRPHCSHNVSQKLKRIKRFSELRLNWGQNVSVATPADRRGETNTIFCTFWAVKNFEKSAGDIFLSGLRGALNISVTFWIFFSDLCSRFSNRFSCQNKNVSGAISFCRRAALIKWGANIRSPDQTRTTNAYRSFKIRKRQFVHKIFVHNFGAR